MSTFTAIAWQEQVLLWWDDDDDHDDDDHDQIGRVMVSTLISSGVAYKTGMWCFSSTNVSRTAQMTDNKNLLFRNLSNMPQ